MICQINVKSANVVVVYISMKRYIRQILQNRNISLIFRNFWGFICEKRVLLGCHIG
jgi:hypothetical protein